MVGEFWQMARRDTSRKVERENWVWSGLGLRRDLNFPHPAPINILLGCRRGQVKNKINDPAAIIHPRDRWMPRIQSMIWN